MHGVFCCDSCIVTSYVLFCRPREQQITYSPTSKRIGPDVQSSAWLANIPISMLDRGQDRLHTRHTWSVEPATCMVIHRFSCMIPCVTTCRACIAFGHIYVHATWLIKHIQISRRVQSISHECPSQAMAQVNDSPRVVTCGNEPGVHRLHILYNYSYTLEENLKNGVFDSIRFHSLTTKCRSVV